MASSARIDELRKKFDENPRRYFAPLANEYRKAGDLEQAIFICQEYLPQQPGHMSGHIVYGQALFELKRLDDAKSVFETALSLDPENLIALRHLGDIARQAGDTNTARTWYQRVLEADPRNEEIAQIMLELLDAGPGAAARPAVDHSAPTPLSTPAVSARAAEPEPVPELSASPAQVEPAAFEVEKTVDTTLDMTLDMTPAEVASEPVASEPVAPEPEPEQEREMLDLGDFAVGGVPLSELRSSRPVAVQPEPEEAPQTSEGADIFDFGAMSSPAAESVRTPESQAEPEHEADAEVPFEADPFAIAAAPPQPEVELATDIELGLPDDGVTPSMDAVEMPMGLETFEAGTLRDAPPVSSESPALEMESFFELPEPPVPVEAESAEAESAEAEPAAPFVTETMAMLYLQQGHLEAALDIYRQLVVQRPDDAGLQERLRAVADRVSGVVSPASETAGDFASRVEEEQPAVASPASYGGPTIRDFLSGLIARRTPVSVQEIPADEYAGEAFNEVAAEAPSEEPAEPPPAYERRPTPSSVDTVGGSLGVLFSGADTAASDAAAANTVAEAAAADGPETAPLQGVPAHRASSELSLDHVFKSGSPHRRQEESGDFSFDQFFADEAAEQPATPVDAPAPTEGGDDIAQFNAWLNGLKKT